MISAVYEYIYAAGLETIGSPHCASKGIGKSVAGGKWRI
jgi:hypothetical protein